MSIDKFVKKEEIYIQIGYAISTKRREMRISQKEMLVKLGVRADHGHISRIERGYVRLRLHQLQEIAAVFGMDLIGFLDFAAKLPPKHLTPVKPLPKLDAAENARFLQILDECQGNVAATAKRFKCTKSSVYRAIDRMGVNLAMLQRKRSVSTIAEAVVALASQNSRIDGSTRIR